MSEREGPRPVLGRSRLPAREAPVQTAATGRTGEMIMDEREGLAHWFWWRVCHLGKCPACHRHSHLYGCWNRPNTSANF